MHFTRLDIKINPLENFVVAERFGDRPGIDQSFVFCVNGLHSRACLWNGWGRTPETAI